MFSSSTNSDCAWRVVEQGRVEGAPYQIIECEICLKVAAFSRPRNSYSLHQLTCPFDKKISYAYKNRPEDSWVVN